MKHRHFIKFDPCLNQLTGCQRATLILNSLEYWFTKKPDGFYKFMEPCSHRLYKKGDSWEEELGYERRCFARSFKKIGIKYKSRGEFEAAPNKFQGKMYASYYDRYTNQTFFIRNHPLADKTLNDFSAIKSPSPRKEKAASNPTVPLRTLPLGTGQNGLSYKEPKNTSVELSNDNSHAGNETIKKMVDTWTAIVGEGKEQIIELKGKLVPFLKQALKDKFGNCLQQWKEYCIRIAQSKFLMGEKTSFKATLDWALKFDVISKILSGGCYGIGDRGRKLTPEEWEELEKERYGKEKAKELEEQRSLQALEEQINHSPLEPSPIKGFRIKWLRTLGQQSYREFLENSTLAVGSDSRELIIQPRDRMTAIRLKSQWNPRLLSGQPFQRVQIYHCIPDFNGKPLIFDCWLGEALPKTLGGEGQGNRNDAQPIDGEDKTTSQFSEETEALRNKLKDIIPPHQYPVWLEGIEVQGFKEDGTGILGFWDPFTASYATSRFYQEILQAGKALWNLNKVTIQGNTGGCLTEDMLGSRGQDEGVSIVQAIKSLVTLKPTFQLKDEIPF